MLRFRFRPHNPHFQKIEMSTSFASGAAPRMSLLMPRAEVRVRSEQLATSPLIIKLRAERFSFYYGNFQALHDISLDIHQHRITALIGPSGCGKSTFLRAMNRMCEMVPRARAAGRLVLDGENISELEVTRLRRRVGMVFQRPNPFPKSIFENVAYGVRIGGVKNDRVLAEIVEKSLIKAALWEEVKDKLRDSAYSLSGGQQQRLCIARALAIDPQVLLLDEPCSALDPISTAKVEETVFSLREACTIVMVTHNLQQAARIADYTAFFMMGRLIEAGPTEAVFLRPVHPSTQDYLTGRLG
jgi:phosphate transport system ATP-binding protein